VRVEGFAVGVEVFLGARLRRHVRVCADGNTVGVGCNGRQRMETVGGSAPTAGGKMPMLERSTVLR
jgi:hypothetical protein